VNSGTTKNNCPVRQTLSCLGTWVSTASPKVLSGESSLFRDAPHHSRTTFRTSGNACRCDRRNAAGSLPGRSRPLLCSLRCALSDQGHGPLAVNELDPAGLCKRLSFRGEHPQADHVAARSAPGSHDAVQLANDAHQACHADPRHPLSSARRLRTGRSLLQVQPRARHDMNGSANELAQQNSMRARVIACCTASR
jgi:hypothetical protein